MPLSCSVDDPELPASILSVVGATLATLYCLGLRPLFAVPSAWKAPPLPQPPAPPSPSPLQVFIQTSPPETPISAHACPSTPHSTPCTVFSTALVAIWRVISAIRFLPAPLTHNFLGAEKISLCTPSV